MKNLNAFKIEQGPSNKFLVTDFVLECNINNLCWLVGFYGISTFVGYLIPNPFYINNPFYFK